jgi:ATP-dependent exoDNAse (exonuclease V) beta subunit
MNNHSNIIIHEASAGSGKTFTLVKNYLSTCLNPKNDVEIFRKILAITFTNKAAKEMKDRIIGQLEAFLNKEEKTQFLAEEFMNLYGYPESDFKERCLLLLQKITHNYSDFSISTIDKFMLRIIRSIRFELGLKDNFEIISDTHDWFEDSIDNLLSDMESDPKLEAYFKKRLKGYIEDGKSWNIRQNISSVAQSIIEEDYQKKYAEFFKIEDFDQVLQIRSDLKQEEENYLQLFKTLSDDLIEFLDVSGLKEIGFSRKNKSIFKFHTFLNSKHFKIEDKTVSDFLKFINKSSHFNKAQEQEQEQFSAYINPKKREFSVLFFQLHQIQLVKKQLKNLEFEYLLFKKLNEYLEEKGYLHLSSFNKLLEEFIDKKEIPMLLMKMGEQYEHIFIDEFQDTSKKQWHNLYPLLENVLAKGHNIHLIGDAKQSIYRFRGGDVQILLDIKSNPKDQIFKSISAPALDTNWRSYREIVQFNNTLYSELLLPELNDEKYQHIYQQSVQKIKHTDKSGYVEFAHYLEEGKKEETNQKNISEVLIRIKDVHSRRGSYDGICVLLRNNTDISLIAEALLKEDIPFINSESLLVFSDRQNVFLKQCLEYLHNPHLSKKKEEILRYIYTYHLSLKDAYSEWYKENNQLEIHEILSKYEIRFPRRIENNFVETLEQIVTTFSLKNNLYLFRFLELAHQFINFGNIRIDLFLQQCATNENKWKINLDNVENAVQLMTVHKSKGLEFPIVILPFIESWKKRSSDNWYPSKIHPLIKEIKTSFSKDIWELYDTDLSLEIAQLKTKFEKDEWFDIVNLFYVATTRAVEELYIINVHKLVKKLKDKIKTRSEIAFILSDLYLEDEQLELDEQVVSFGEKETGSNKEKAIVQSVNWDYSIDREWQEKILITNKTEDIQLLEGEMSAQEIGNHIHEILAHIEKTTDFDKAINQYFSQIFIPKEEQNTWKKIVREIINHPNLKNYFSENIQVKNERDWLGIDGKVIRPDRIIEMPNGDLIIMDYKTGKPDESHRFQLENYRNQLYFSGKYPKVKNILVYTENLEIVEF